MAKILGIESSGRMASVAIISEEEVLAEISMNTKLTHSETLLPMIDEVVKKSGCALEELDTIAIAEGPGSFTGLRIGASTAKGLGLALDIPLIAVSTLEGLAYNVWSADANVVPLMDARRSQVYTAEYAFQGGKLQTVVEPKAEDIQVVIDRINAGAKPVIFVGDGASLFREKLEAEVYVQKNFAPAAMNRQRAAAIASRGLELFLEGKTVYSDDFVPVYLRKSQAERVREEGK